MTVRCGNRVHGRFGRTEAHHETVAQVALCFKRPGGLTTLEEAAAVEEAKAELVGMGLDPDTGYPPVEDPGVCEHQMSAALCAGPDHYPSAEQERADSSEWMTTSQLMSATSADYHRRGENCPWDCSRCPGNIAADEAERAAILAEEQAAYDAGRHIPACRYAGLPLTTSQGADDCCCTPPVTPTVIYDGIYTIETPSGHRTFRVRTQGPDEDFAAGSTVIAFLSGPDNTRDYTGCGFVVHRDSGSSINVWKKHRGNEALLRDLFLFSRDVEGALKQAHCRRCHRVLTVPTSVHNGYGPECIKKVGT